MTAQTSSDAHPGEPDSQAGALLATGLLGRNTVINLVGQALPLVVAVGAIPPLIRGIGTERFGLLVIAWILLGYFSLFDMGLGRSLTQLAAERIGQGRGERIPALARTGLALMAILGVAAGGLLWLVAPPVARGVLNVPPELREETLAALRLLALAVPFVVVTAGLRGLLEAFQRFGWVNAVRIPQGILTYLGPLAVLPFSRGLPALVGALVVVRVGAWAAHAVLVRKVLGKERGDDHEVVPSGREDVRELFRTGGWITVSNLVGPLMVYLDRFLIGAVLTAAAVAYYATPFEVVSRLWIIPGAIVAVFFPAFATSFRADPERTAALFGASGRVILAVVFPLALLLMAFAPEGLALWVGPEFADPGAPVARWLLLGILINAVAQVPFAFLQGVGRPDVTAKLHLLEAPIYFLLLWWLLGSWGITGAAVAWTLRVLLDAVLLFWLSGKVLRGTRRATREIAGWTAAGLVLLGVSAWPLDALVPRVGIVAAIGVLWGAVAWFRLLPRIPWVRFGPGARRS